MRQGNEWRLVVIMWSNNGATPPATISRHYPDTALLQTLEGRNQAKQFYHTLKYLLYTLAALAVV